MIADAGAIIIRHTGKAMAIQATEQKNKTGNFFIVIVFTGTEIIELTDARALLSG